MRVLFTFGDWVVTDGASTNKGESSCAGHSHNTGFTYEYAWFLSDNFAHCYSCREPVPDEIQTVLALLGAV